MVVRIVSLFRHRVMDGEVSGHAARHKLLLHKPAHQLQPFLLVELMRQGHGDLPRHLRVLTVFHSFGVIPERLPVLHPVRRALGQQNFRVPDTFAATEVLVLLQPHVPQFLSRAIRCSRHG